MGPFNNLRVMHTYFVHFVGGGEQRVLCTASSGGSLQTWAAVTVEPGPTQAYTIVEASTRNNTYVFVLWLIQEGQTWQIQSFQFVPASMVGKYAEDLRALAEEQKRALHNFNAYILYRAALQLTNRGPYFQLGIQQEVQNSMKALQVPQELQAQAPFSWTYGKSVFKVLDVGPLGIAGKIYLAINHQVEPWTDNKEVDTENRELITEFTNTHPEYKDAFAGIVGRAYERGTNRTFGTVEENNEKSQ